MRRIAKTHPPQELRDWCEENRELNHTYPDLSGHTAHEALKTRLLEEQGYICAYTGRTIDSENSHIEHLKPQSKCEEWEDVEYRNVVACFPADGGDTSHGYGAPIKADWWENELFVSPLSDDCDRRFHFVWSGHVYPNPADHAGAKRTIEMLQLDHKKLQDLRRAEIMGFFGLGRNSKSKAISKEEAARLLSGIDRRDGMGKLKEFCFVLKQLLPRYIKGGKQ